MRLFFAFLLLGSAVDAAAAPPFELHGDEFERVRGEYVLPGGHAMWLAGTRRHPHVEFDDAPSQALHAVSATEFVGVDGCTRIVFETNANSTVARVRVTRACGA